MIMIQSELYGFLRTTQRMRTKQLMGIMNYFHLETKLQIRKRKFSFETNASCIVLGSVLFEYTACLLQCCRLAGARSKNRRIVNLLLMISTFSKIRWRRQYHLQNNRMTPCHHRISPMIRFPRVRIL